MNSLCPVCGTWAGRFADVLKDGHHRDCPARPGGVVVEPLVMIPPPPGESFAEVVAVLDREIVRQRRAGR
jgi:hypothetical protein